MLTHSLQCHAGLAPPRTGASGRSLPARGVALGLIADGVHVHPTMAVLLQRLAPDQTVLVSDALAPYGLQPMASTAGMSGCCWWRTAPVVSRTAPWRG